MGTHKHSEARRKRRAKTRANPSGTLPRPSIADLDPSDPTQELDELGEFHIELAVEAQPSAEAQEDLEVAEEEAEAEAAEDEPARDEAEAGEGTPDTGDLYGVHAVPAEDTDLSAAEDQDSFQDSSLGETFFEALEQHAAENGAAPEHELDIVDDSDRDHPGHHATESGDRPVADKGSGGPAGV